MTLLRRIFARNGQHDSIAELAIGALCLLIGFVALCFLPLVRGP